MDKSREEELARIYRDGLLEDTLPFWLNHALDREYGGYVVALDRDGSVLDTDKAVWPQGRFAWLLSTLCDKVEKRAEWMEAARLGIEFLERHAFDTDGRMFFLLTREGKPLRKRRYLFTETFGAIAFAAWAKVSGDEKAAGRARELFDLVLRYSATPGFLEPKLIPGTRRTKGLGLPMILIATAQVLRDALEDDGYTKYIDQYIEEIRRDFMKPEFEALLETVTPEGEFLDHFDGRLITPGHGIEAAWFILHEALLRGGDPELVRTGTTILDWMWKWGWDEEYGGILYFRDVKGLPVQEYWQDMKFWWPHNEAVLATLYAWKLTGEKKYADWHRLVHDWSYAHFPDPEYGEWFGYLHRDGSISVPLKGNHWKGPFHLPRMQLFCWKLLEGTPIG